MSYNGQSWWVLRASIVATHIKIPNVIGGDSSYWLDGGICPACVPVFDGSLGTMWKRML